MYQGDSRVVIFHSIDESIVVWFPHFLNIIREIKKYLTYSQFLKIASIFNPKIQVLTVMKDRP